MLQYAHEEIIGLNEAINHVLNQAEQVADTDTTAMLLGQTGTGKEIFAQTRHKLSRKILKLTGRRIRGKNGAAEVLGRKTRHPGI